MFIKYIYSILLLSFSLMVQAEQFQAPLTDTHWQVTETPLMCTLSQTIADFGEAKFQRQSGGQLRLIFTSKSYPATQATAHFELTEAPWQNINQRTLLTSMASISGQTEFVLSGSYAKQALSQIQEGQFPTLRYHSKIMPDEISVLLSTVHLADFLPAFQQCLNKLPSYSFEDISKLTLYFASGLAKLTPQSQQALTKLADYVKMDSSVKRITITSHTDNNGQEQLNKALSVSRAMAIKNFLTTQSQIKESLISIYGQQAAKPVSSNKSAAGRALNRRAEIEILR